jgi:hypothetical protein
MDINQTYVMSQVFTILMYALLGITYQVKSRKKILVLSIFSNAFKGIAYLLLNAKSGFVMCVLAILRETAMMFILDKIKDEKKSKRAYLCVIIVFYIAMIISAIFTYEGMLSMLSILATAIYTYSIWQKNEKIYKALGTPIGICWIAYNIFVKSLFGVILESIILICSIVGYVRSKKTEKI